MWDRSKSVWTWEAVPGGAIPRLQEVVGSSRKDGLHPGLAFSLESYHPPHGSPPASSTLACVSSPTKCTISSLACSPSSFGPNPVYTVLDPTSIQMLLDNTALRYVLFCVCNTLQYSVLKVSHNEDISEYSCINSQLNHVCWLYFHFIFCNV